jgi:hypothetical protein
MFGPTMEDKFLDDGTIWKEYAKDGPFVDVGTIVHLHCSKLVTMCMLGSSLNGH